ncbi:MAG: FAD-dependent oxidoreductase [Dysgonamonadaceae bacterium]|jgi:hypothetical protein|nr:FAD-dependent oxidoreductase [Dysgonamonadaceae bacterium]
MRLIVFTFLSVLISYGCANRKAENVDICIYGGNASGVIAAFAAKQAGKSVLLVEPGQRLGGMSSGGLGQTDIGNKQAITGLARDFYRRVGKHYGVEEQWTFEPKVAEEIFKDYINRASIDVLYNHRLHAVKTSSKKITEITVEHSNNPSAKLRRIKAKVFIDCSYEGDLMAKAGVSYTIGREANSVYNETLNGVQMANAQYHQFPDGIDPYIVPGKPESGLLWGISPETLQPDGTGDNKVQAYNFRICLTSDSANMIPIERPDGYDSTRYELLARLIAAEHEKTDRWGYFIWSDMPNNKTDINNREGFSTDMIGMNYDYPEASYAEREKIVREHEIYTKGLLYFLGHDTRVTESIRKDILRWGYPKDEYPETNHWTPQLYIREARRMIGEYVMTQANCQGKTTVDDGVGLAAYTMDSHHIQRLVINGMVKNEGDVQVGGFPPYPVSYRSLTPKREECRNLLVPVCLSASHIAYGSIRMEPVFMVLGESAAMAASMSIDTKKDIQDIDVKILIENLKMSVPQIKGASGNL